MKLVSKIKIFDKKVQYLATEELYFEHTKKISELGKFLSKLANTGDMLTKSPILSVLNIKILFIFF